MSDVSVVSCPDYEPEHCRAALLEALGAVDGLSFLKPGMRVAIKVNLVTAMKPDTAATTHPALVCELTKLLRERGASVVIGDSPGGVYNSIYLNHVYSVCGLNEAEKDGASLNQDFSQKTASYPRAVVAKTFQYTAWLDDADAIIDFCKLKSHGMMGMSGAAKNLFGTIPGTLKPEYHFRFPDPKDFARMIVDLDEYWKPVLSIADAVVGMEGNGPTMGTPRHIGAVLASKNPHKLDLVCAKLIGLSRQDVPTLEAAFERDLIPAAPEALDIYGQPEQFVLSDFENLETKNSLLFKNEFGGIFGKIFGEVVQACLRSHPAADVSTCIGCEKCASICPANAITMRDKLPHIDRSKCIHCFCCQEFCPKGAMKVARPAVARILNHTK